jgi:O-antigen ligase
MKFLDILSKGLFILGFLMVGTLGTAPDVPFHMLGLPLCGAGGFLAALVRWKSGPPLQAGLLPTLLLPVIAYLAWRAAASPVRHFGEMDLFLISAFLAGFGMVWFTGKVRWIEPWLWLLAIGGGVLGVLQVMVDDQLTLLKALGMRRPVDVPHASGFFFNPNPSGTWNAMLLLLSFARLVYGGGGAGNRILAGGAAVAAGTGLLLSFCRAAFFGGALGAAVMISAVVVVVAKWRTTGPRKAGAVALICLGLGAVGWFGSGWVEQLAQRRTASGKVEDLANIEARYPYWRTGLSQFLDSPAIGAGSRSFSYESYDYWDSSLPFYQKDPDYVHNEYIQLLTDYGFAGLALVLLFVFASYSVGFRQAARIARREQTREGRAKLSWALGSLGAGTALLGDVYFSFSGHFAPMVLLAGVLVGGLAAIDEAEMRRRVESTARLPAVLVMSIWLAVAVFLAWPGAGYGWATGRVYLAISAYQNNRLDTARYLGIAERQAKVLPRFPMFLHAGDFASAVATGGGGSDDAMSREKALEWFNKALEAFPESLDARLERATLLQKMGRYAKADEDYALAAERGKHREFYYRSWMKWGEARRDRAIEAWQMGDIETATRWLKLSLAAYDESKRLAWIHPDDLRYRKGRENVEELIAFFRRTGEWPSEDTPATAP